MCMQALQRVTVRTRSSCVPFDHKAGRQTPWHTYWQGRWVSLVCAHLWQCVDTRVLEQPLRCVKVVGACLYTEVCQHPRGCVFHLQHPTAMVHNNHKSNKASTLSSGTDRMLHRPDRLLLLC